MRGVTRYSFLQGAITLVAVAALCPAAAPHQREKIDLSPFVAKLLADETLPSAERRRLTIFHGQWNAVSDQTIAERADIALQRYDLANSALQDEAVPPLLRARAALLRGEPAAALKLVSDDASLRGASIRAAALERLGRPSKAIAVLKPAFEAVDGANPDTADGLTAAATMLVTLARLEGRPSRDYHRAMGMLAKAHQEIDRLYWPAKLAEAELLIDKDNNREAMAATLEALSLNPRAGRAWYLLGQLGLAGYNFEQADRAARSLRKINSRHLLADLLEIRTLLQQKDLPAAHKAIAQTLERYPTHRELLALAAAADALSFRSGALAMRLNTLDELSPDSPLAHYTVGRYLSMARQYESGERHLRLAIERSPNWAAPRLELGLLLMQSGKEKQALIELTQAKRLDPFRRAVANQLKLVKQLLDYEQIRTPHFIIKYPKGIDEVLARDMVRPLERIYDDITSVYGYRPPTPTSVEIMPDKQWFAVRITGMPDIWTIAACTGDVIALVSPREGAHQSGPFDWENVVRHEYVHTVTLNQTGYRIPHWFTEACAVAQERTGRDYTSYRLLAQAVRKKKLFDLDQINWAFVRPKTPQDRPLAYAQSHWMAQYITESHGHDTIVQMLGLYRKGASNKDAIAIATGWPADKFMAGFRQWAGAQIKQWGMDKKPFDKRVRLLLSQEDQAGDDMLKSLLSQYPDHPDLLRLAAERALALQDYDTARTAVLRYASARPVDPWSSKALVRLAWRDGRGEDAVGPLEQLDRSDAKSPSWAGKLAQLHRAAGRFDQAAAAATRALYREPYNAAYRELAAAIDVQRGNLNDALHHVRALTLLEPHRSHQWVRLAALHHRMGDLKKAKEAAETAKQLDPQAPVERFLE